MIEKIADMENLRLAFWKAKKGKNKSNKIAKFVKSSLEESLLKLRHQILLGELNLKGYHFFRIFDPKERLVCAAPFEQRVLHHAIMNICHEDFERYLISDTYATRLGKGTYKALDRAMHFQKKHRFCLKLDIRKYFDSIDHCVLKSMLARVYKDPKLLNLFDAIIDSYCSTAGKGVPIGNLTSQYFANHYLSVFDRIMKEKWHVAGYVRYMDDIIVWGDDLRELKEIGRAAKYLLLRDLKLTLKVCQIKPCLQRTTFLGYQISAKGIRLARRSVIRYKKNLKKLFNLYDHNQIDEEQMNRRLQPMIAFVDKVNAKALKKQALVQCCN